MKNNQKNRRNKNSITQDFNYNQIDDMNDDNSKNDDNDDNDNEINRYG